jgi:adenylyl-sulfate kinase
MAPNNTPPSTPTVATNLVAVSHQLTAAERASHIGHTGALVWLTGLPGSGKSTLAMALERALFDLRWQAYTLDGDNVRRGLNADLGFSPRDRQENIRRIGEVAALFADAGTICITAFISPYREDRSRARAAAGARRFFEVHVNSGLETCERRDPKGHYRKARAGLLRDFTGVDAPYERPASPDITIDTEAQDIDACVSQLLEYVVVRCSVATGDRSLA